MLVPEIDGVKYSVVFFVKASEVQYQFISFKTNVILYYFINLLLKIFPNIDKLTIKKFNFFFLKKISK